MICIRFPWAVRANNVKVVLNIHINIAFIYFNHTFANKNKTKNK